MKKVATICVYGEFEKKEIRIKVFPTSENEQRHYIFQNILREAGYDAELFSINDNDISPA